MRLSKLKEMGLTVSSTYNHVLAKLSVMLMSGMAAISAHAADGFDFDGLADDGQTAEDVAENADNVMKIIFNIIKALGVLVGFWLVYLGIMRIKKANEPNSNTSPMQGALFILLGGCLGALPFIFLSSATIVQG